jgi:hypothetical protein
MSSAAALAGRAPGPRFRTQHVAQPVRLATGPQPRKIGPRGKHTRGRRRRNDDGSHPQPEHPLGAGTSWPLVMPLRLRSPSSCREAGAGRRRPMVQGRATLPSPDLLHLSSSNAAPGQIQQPPRDRARLTIGVRSTPGRPETLGSNSSARRHCRRTGRAGLLLAVRPRANPPARGHETRISTVPGRADRFPISISRAESRSHAASDSVVASI